MPISLSEVSCSNSVSGKTHVLPFRKPERSQGGAFNVRVVLYCVLYCGGFRCSVLWVFQVFCIVDISGHGSYLYGCVAVHFTSYSLRDKKNRH